MPETPWIYYTFDLKLVLVFVCPQPLYCWQINCDAPPPHTHTFSYMKLCGMTNNSLRSWAPGHSPPSPPPAPPTPPTPSPPPTPRSPIMTLDTDTLPSKPDFNGAFEVEMY